jgi:DNA-binding FadR family transcriptional regulator
VAEAVMARDPDTAAAAYHRHLAQIRDTTLQTMDRMRQP